VDILELLPDAVFVVAQGAADGRILYANAQATRMFGYERGALIGQPIELLVPHRLLNRHTHHRRDSEAPRLRAMGAGLTSLGRRRDGTEFPIDVQLNSSSDGADPVTIAIVRDSTERTLLEETFTQARDSAVRANEVKSRFLAAASHDLRQPLQTIWSLHSILSRALKDSAIAPQLALLEEAVRSMDQMLSSLIDINRLEQGAIHPVIRDFASQEILPRLRSEFGYFAASKSLVLQVEESAEFARSDAMLLPVILRNLLGNAIKYTQHGSVRLHVRVRDPYLYIDVIDSGPGIPREHLDRLFDAFYQIDNPSHDQRRGSASASQLFRPSASCSTTRSLLNRPPAKVRPLPCSYREAWWPSGRRNRWQGRHPPLQGDRDVSRCCMSKMIPELRNRCPCYCAWRAMT
jgi:two-component system, sensor histidine kinase